MPQSKFVEFKELKDQDSPGGSKSKPSKFSRYRPHKRSRSRSNSPRRDYDDRFSRRKKKDVELNFSLFNKPGGTGALSFKEKANVLLANRTSQFY